MEEKYVTAKGIMYANELNSIPKSSNKLQPLHEAFSNSLDAIEERFRENTSKGSIAISLHYMNDCMFEEEHLEKYRFVKLEIVDNGAGLNTASYRRLECLRDSSKSAKNRGTGRIQFVHFFKEAIIESYYSIGNKHLFKKVTLSKNPDFLSHNSILRIDEDKTIEDNKTSTTVVLNDLQNKKDQEFYDTLSLSEIKQALVKHYISRLCELKDRFPNITLEKRIESNLIESNFIKEEDIPSPSQTKTFEVKYSKLDGKKVVDANKKVSFTLLSFVQDSSKLSKNSIWYVSNGALAQEEAIDAITKNDSIDGKRYLFLLKSEYFDSIDDDVRGNLHFVKEADFKKQNENSLFPEECLLIDRIKMAYNKTIADSYPELKQRKNDALLNLDELQKLFLLDKDVVDTFRKKIKSSDSDEQILQEIYKSDLKMMAERDANLKRQMDSIEKLSPDMPNYQAELEKQIEDFVLTVPIQNRTSLTKYVARRKMVLKIFDNILENEKILAKKGGHIKEKILHDLFFQQKSTSTSLSDLWLFDEQCLYFQGSSDIKFDDIVIGNTKLIKANSELSLEEKEYKERTYADAAIIDVGNKRPDILLYPDEGKCIIIEFKAPNVDVSRHLSQMYAYARIILNLSYEQFHIDRFYGYLVGENVNFESVLDNSNDFRPAYGFDYLFCPNYVIRGKFGRHDGSMYAEILKYSSLLERAKVRNKAFIDKLDGGLMINRKESKPLEKEDIDV